MGIHVVAMLTYNDQTVRDAFEVFKANQGAKTQCWGFKDIGIGMDEAVELVARMKEAGKITFLEPLREDEESCLLTARMAVECRFDYVIGMVGSHTVREILQKNGIRYMPTCGRRSGLPRMLYGTHEEIIRDGAALVQDGADGLCLSSYRYADGDPEALTREFLQKVHAPLIISGGINTFSRLDFVKRVRPWGFTIGSALFAHQFGDGKSVAEQLDVIQDYIDT